MPFKFMAIVGNTIPCCGLKNKKKYSQHQTQEVSCSAFADSIEQWNVMHTTMHRVQGCTQLTTPYIT